jgi:hypothetical protein
VITALYISHYDLSRGVFHAFGLAGGQGGVVGSAGGVVGSAGGQVGVVGFSGGVVGVVGLDIGSGCLVIFFTSFFL